MLVTLAKHAKK